MLALLGWFAVLPFLGTAILRLRSRPNAGVVRRFAEACGRLSLWAIPAIAVQDVMWLASGGSVWSRIEDSLLAFPMQWWVLAGGASVQAFFEAYAREISGHRQSTMIDNWVIYWSATLVWTSIWSGAYVALRGAAGRAAANGARALPWLFLVNALLGVTWPWWGT